MKNKKVVITGGAGFIGSNLAWELSKENEVVIIDDLSTGKIKNIQSLIDNELVTFVKGSVTDSKLLHQILTDIDYVFHMAALVSVPKSFMDPILTSTINVNGTVNVLSAALENNVAKVVNASSCAVYGDSTDLPLHEESTTRPLSSYAMTKLIGEHYCDIFSNIHGLSVVSLRYFNVFGPRQDPLNEYAAVIPIFISRALDEKPLIIYGDGTQTRDFVFVNDVVRANIFFAEKNITRIFNIGSGKNVSINEIADWIEEIYGKSTDKTYEPEREGDILHSIANVSKSKEVGFEAETDLYVGLQKTFEWFEDQSKKPEIIYEI